MPMEGPKTDGPKISGGDVNLPTTSLGDRVRQAVLPSVAIEQWVDGAIAVTIETERLLIAPVTRSDIADYQKHLFGDPVVMKKFAAGTVLEPEEVEKRVETWVKRWDSGDPFAAIAIRMKSGEFVGHIVLGHGDHSGQSEIAFLIRKDLWKQGFTTEAVAGVVEGLAPLLRAYGFKVEDRAFSLIDATARPDNPASGKILSNMGMEVVRTSEKFNSFREHFQMEAPLPDSQKRWEILVFEDRTLAREKD
jgi:RimJ/RimL family protein N-acetyltransferase